MLFYISKYWVFSPKPMNRAAESGDKKGVCAARQRAIKALTKDMFA